MVVSLGDYMNVKCLACIGGTNVQVGITKLKEGQHVIVGTPGRVYDMLNRGSLGKWTQAELLNIVSWHPRKTQNLSWQ